MDQFQIKDEISLKDLFLKVFYFVKLIKKNIFSFLIIITTVVFLSYFIPSEIKYTSKSTLIFNSGSGGNKLLSLASNFGFGESTNVITFERFKSISKSKMLLNKIFYKSVEIDGKLDLIGHHLINNFNWREIWQQDRPNLANVDLNIAGANRDTVLSFLYLPVLADLEISEDDGDLVIIVFKSNNESIALNFNKLLVQESMDFFYKSYIDKDIQTRHILKSRLDSIQRNLNILDLKYSNLKDNSYKTVKAKGYIDLLRVERHIKILSAMLIEAKKQYEIMNFKVLNAKNSIQKVDVPINPLPFSVMSLYVKLFIGLSVGFFFASLFLIAKDFLKKRYTGLKKIMLED